MSNGEGNSKEKSPKKGSKKQRKGKDSNKDTDIGDAGDSGDENTTKEELQDLQSQQEEQYNEIKTLKIQLTAMQGQLEGKSPKKTKVWMYGSLNAGSEICSSRSKSAHAKFSAMIS